MCADEAQKVSQSVQGAGGATLEAVKVAGNQFWTQITNFKGNLVYQRPDLIDPRLSQGGLTNLQRMQAGRPPIGPDGLPMQVHYMLQTMNGPQPKLPKHFIRHMRV